MKNYLQKSLSLLALLVVTNAAYAAYIITITGTSTFPICPGVTASLTATAKLSGVSVNGAYDWAFTFDGGANWTPINGTISCPAGNFSSSSINFPWPDANKQGTLRVRFAPYAIPGCPLTTKTQALWVIGAPGIPATGPSDLSFCYGSETKTLTIAGISCSSWGTNNYEWIVPSGWTIVANGGISYTTITGGISTRATSVSVTSPSSVVSRYAGNYFITVRTPSGYAFPASSTGQIYIGTPDVPGSVTGNSSPPEGSTQQYHASSMAEGSSYITWIMPYSGGWSIQSYPNETTVRALVGSGSGNVQAVAMNGCGAGGAALLWVTPSGGGGCNPCPRMAAPELPEIPFEELDAVDPTVELSPNPVRSIITINGRGHGLTSGPVHFVDARGISHPLEARLERKGVLAVDCQTLSDGLYVVNVPTSEGMLRKKIIKISQ